MATNLDLLYNKLGGSEKDPLEEAILPARAPVVEAPAPVPPAATNDDETAAMLITTMAPALLGLVSGDKGARAASKTSDSVIPMWSAQQKLRAEEKKDARKLALEQEKELRREARQDENAARTEDRFNRQLQASADRQDRALAARDKSDKEKGREVPAGTAESMGASDAAFKQIDDLDTSLGAIKDFNAAGQLNPARYIPGNKTSDTINTFEAQRRAAAQSIGTFLEGGKLTDADFDNKYLPMLPSVNDSEKVRVNKLDSIRRLVTDRVSSTQEALKGAGFNTSRMVPPKKAPRNPLDSNNQDKPSVVKKEFSPSRNMTRVTYSDGRVETVEGKL